MASGPYTTLRGTCGGFLTLVRPESRAVPIASFRSSCLLMGPPGKKEFGGRERI